ncbi:alpha/beta fold hydrolase [Amycolatopsis viridis]|uniref:Pimeloyl-ACP methyl ester carboxylesterase n=1 Tax=Amycolatopsis viridis TaxID=185678 RepID=A0ABX0T1Z2_9PSEU|nr:alpha/beta hydrolase [Amycolatopsis viridis]NIH81880.1 pimeloyl-ACP methyl ester carboxylesterase [Amycolatopsis viridis]
MERFETPDGTVRWTRSGAGSPVVLMHGTPFSSYVWRDVAAALADRHEVFAWDMLGYGQSEKRAGQDVSLGTQAKIFTSLLEHWGLDEPAVVAHDFGGVVSLRAHLLHGARYRRLALVDAVAIAPWGTSFFRLVRENAAVFERLPAHLHEAIVRTQTATASRPGLRAEVLDRLAEPWLGDDGQAAFYRQMAQADQRYTDEIEPLLGSLDLPVLVCWGEADEWLPVERGKDLASRIPGAQLRLLPGAGHLVQEDAPAALTATLLDFLPA